MSQTSIEWTEQTWNPIVGCSVVSPGRTNCYAMKMAARLEAMGTPRYAGLTRSSKAGPVWTGELRLVEDALTIPLRRRKPTTYFVNSMSDLFHESVPDEWIDRVFAVMALAPQHTFQALTKRSGRMRVYLNHKDTPHRIALACGDLMMAGHLTNARGKPNRIYERTVRHPQDADGWLPQTLWAWPIPNVWPGVSAEDQRRADERVPNLLATPAAVRFVSAEPLLGPIDFTTINRPAPLGSMSALPSGEDEWERATIDWLIVGGDSGPGARPMNPAWARSIRDQCDAAGVAYLFKQWGAWREPIEGEAYNTLYGRAGRPPAFIVADDGTVHCTEEQLGQRAGTVMVMVGKKAAGRLLDGVTHDGFPRSLTQGAAP